MKYPMCTLSNIINPGMYVVVTTDKEHVSEVKKLEDCMTEEMLDDDAPKVELNLKMCVAVFFKDRLARGVIEKKVHNDVYEIVLMDYGHIIQVKKSAIKVITNEDYIKVEPLAFVVKLYGLIPAKYIFSENVRVPKALKDWGLESQIFVQNFFKENHRIVVQSILIQQRTVYGDLFIKDRLKMKYISLRKLLCKNEFCAYSESVFLKHERLNDPSETVEMETKMEMVKKWQQENFEQFKKSTYQFPSVLESENPNSSCSAMFSLLDSKTLDCDLEETHATEDSSTGEEISTSSFDKFQKFGMGRGKLRLLIADMKIKEQATTENPTLSSHSSNLAEKVEEFSRVSRGRGQFRQKYLESRKAGISTDSSYPAGSTSESESTRNSDMFSEACGGDVLRKRVECASKELPKFSILEKAVVKPGQFSDFSDSYGLTEASLSTEGDNGPPPLVGNCTIISNLEDSKVSGEKSDCEIEIERNSDVNKNSEETESENEKNKDSSSKEENVDSSCLKAEEVEGSRNVGRKRNVFESWEKSSSTVALRSCWTPFVAFDDTIVESVNTFRELPIQPSIITNLEKKGTFNNLSQVQRWAIPAIRKQHNTIIIGSSKTGKTLSYLVPLLDYVQDEFYFEELPRGNGPSVVIVASSSRVCENIYYICHSLLRNCSNKKVEKSDVKVIMAHGCGCEKEVWVPLTNGCDILISTPHCLVRLLEHPVLTNFERLTCLVLDEIDVITQTAFIKNVRIILEKAQLSTKGRYYQKILCGEKWTPYVERLVTTYVKSYALVIGSYQEAVIFKGLKPKIFLVDKNRKADILLEKLEEEAENHLKIVIFCESTADAIFLKELFSEKNITSLVAHEKMLAEKLKETEKIWRNSNESVLVMTDGVLSELCIREAQALVHYGLPSRSKTNFFLRYTTVLNFYDKTRNIRRSQGRNLSDKVIILVDDENHYQLPHIAEFVSRLGGELPRNILERCEEIRRLIEIGKSTSICGNLLSFGSCRNFRECVQRHALVQTQDSPEGLPTSGWVSFAVVKSHNTSLFSATLLDHVDLDGKKSKFEDRRSETLEKVAEFFKIDDNKRPHGVPKIGDLCGVMNKILEEEVFYRARVTELLKLDKYSKPLEVSVKLLDEGDVWKRKVMELYELPEELAKLPPSVVDIRVVGVQPLDFDVSWSLEANAFAKNLMTQKLETNKYWSGKIVLALRDTLFLDPIKRKEFLPHLNIDVFDLVLCGELLNRGIAVTNKEHLPPLLKLCKEAEIELPKTEEIKKEDSAKVQPQWAFFDSDFMNVVFLAAENISTVFLQPKKYEKLLEALEEDCQKEGMRMTNTEKSPKGQKTNAPIEKLTVGMFCLAQFEDGKWNRGRIELEKETQFEVFFIDHGDFLFVSKENVVPIPQALLLRLPCQILTGHGCFNHFLHRIQKADTTKCAHCEHEDDTAEHTLQECPAWTKERKALQETIPNLQLANIIQEVLHDEEKWNALSEFSKQVMVQKEVAERSRKEQIRQRRAIECRLVGLEDEDCSLEVLQEIYAFSDDGKQNLLARIISKESTGLITKGRKYNVNLFNRKGVSLSKMLVDNEMVRVKESERCHLTDMETEFSDGEEEKDEDEEEEEEEEDGKEEDNENWEEHKEEIDLNGEKDTGELKTSAENSLDNYLKNLKDDVFEDEVALEFLKEFASKLFPKLDGFQELDMTTEEEKICKKTVENSPKTSESLKESENSKTAAPAANICPEAEVQKKRQSKCKKELELKNQDKVLTPQVLWCQNQGEIRLRIMLGNVSDYSFQVTHSNISFRCLLGEKFYAVDLRLFGAVNPEMTKITTKAFHVSVVLTKLASPLWPRLHLDEGKHRWISLDVEGFKDDKNKMTERIKTAKKEIEAGNLKEGLRSDTIQPCSDFEDSEDNIDNSDSSDSDNDI